MKNIARLVIALASAFVGSLYGADATLTDCTPNFVVPGVTTTLQCNGANMAQVTAVSLNTATDKKYATASAKSTFGGGTLTFTMTMPADMGNPKGTPTLVMFNKDGQKVGESSVLGIKSKDFADNQRQVEDLRRQMDQLRNQQQVVTPAQDLSDLKDAISALQGKVATLEKRPQAAIDQPTRMLVRSLCGQINSPKECSDYFKKPTEKGAIALAGGLEKKIDERVGTKIDAAITAQEAATKALNDAKGQFATQADVTAVEQRANQYTNGQIAQVNQGLAAKADKTELNGFVKNETYSTDMQQVRSSQGTLAAAMLGKKAPNNELRDKNKRNEALLAIYYGQHPERKPAAPAPKVEKKKDDGKKKNVGGQNGFVPGKK